MTGGTFFGQINCNFLNCDMALFSCLFPVSSHDKGIFKTFFISSLTLIFLLQINAVLFSQQGSNYKELLYFGETEKPKITKETDLLVKIYAVPINPSDLYYISGLYTYFHLFYCRNNTFLN